MQSLGKFQLKNNKLFLIKKPRILRIRGFGLLIINLTMVGQPECEFSGDW
jgi:hypothetical protein